MIDYTSVGEKRRARITWERVSDRLSWALAWFFAAVFFGLMAAVFLGVFWLALKGPAP